MPNCVFCEDNGETHPAAFFAPQVGLKPGAWDWSPTCAMHASGWWDASDYPDGIGAPALVPIPAG